MMKKCIFATLLIIVTAGIFFAGFKSGSDRNFKLSKNMDVFNAVIKELEMCYVDTINPDKAVRRGIDAMLMSLDPYTNYYPEEDQDELELMVKGSYGGIGSLLLYDPTRKRSVMAEPYEHMPADQAGIKAGDILLEIDNQDLIGKTDTEVRDMLRGRTGTSFKLKVERPGEDKPMDFNIVRKSIQLPTVPYHGVVEGSTGYIGLSSFSGNPSQEFKQAFTDLTRNQGITSLIIDLRDNGGGLLDEAVEIVNFFVPRGKVIVTTKGRMKQSEGTYKTMREPIDLDMPLVVLVNDGTASSAEILAGALQDLDRAVIVGSRTFGKGLVQVPRPLPYGGSLKVTVSKYYIPSGRCVQAIDYKHHLDNDDQVKRMPDSLTTVFHTAAGREVRDGGGVIPDIAIKPDTLPGIFYPLLKNNIIFNYATNYRLKHPTIASARDFALTDADYDEFKTMVKQNNVEYDRQSLRILKALKEAALYEGYHETTAPELASLEKKLTHNLEHDLDYHATDIKSMIAVEIVKRYYYQRGSIARQLQDDKELHQAVKILGETEHYKLLLQPKTIKKG